MKKATLSENPFLQAKQRFLVENLPEADRIVTRDEIELAFGVVERPDATKVPMGRVQPGDFSITLDFADNEARNAYWGWWQQSKDQGGKARNANAQIDFSNPRSATIPGIGHSTLVSGHYKRQVTIIFHRLYQAQGVENKPTIILLTGCFVTTCSIPDYDMAGEDSSMLSLTISYDDGEIVTNS